MKISLFLMTEKGLKVLSSLIENGYKDYIGQVIIAHDKNVLNDYYDEMLILAKSAGLDVHDKNEKIQISTEYALTIMWRWLIPLQQRTKLLVTHDSLLPKYRGYAPLVNMIINREPRIGVTALVASEEFDRGPLIAQESISVSYPIKIEDAIQLELPLFGSIANNIFKQLKEKGTLESTPQNESEATYGLWRDEEDYHIDWSRDSSYLQQFIYSVGYPYKGAYSIIDGEIYRIIDCEEYPDVIIENRTPGKLLFMIDKCPLIVCGKGMLKITRMLKEDGTSALPMKKYRLRLK